MDIMNFGGHKVGCNIPVGAPVIRHPRGGYFFDGTYIPKNLIDWTYFPVQGKKEIVKEERIELANGMTSKEITEEYTEWRKTLIHGQQEQDASFDRHVLAFSAGSFGVSFAFIDKVISLDIAVHKEFLIVSWICFAVVLLVELIGFRISSWTYLQLQKDANDVAEKRLKGTDADYKDNRLGRNLTIWQNRLTLLLFAGGMICLVFFVMINLL